MRCCDGLEDNAFQFCLFSRNEQYVGKDGHLLCGFTQMKVCFSEFSVYDWL